MKDISLALLGFCLGVLAIWVKDWIERKTKRNRKRAALAALCISELNDFKLTLERIHGFRRAGMSPLFGYSIPTLLFSLLDALIETDLRHVQIYNTMLGNMKRVSLLEQSLHDTLSSGKATEENLDKLYKQLEYTLSCLAQNQLKYLRVHAPERLGQVVESLAPYRNCVGNLQRMVFDLPCHRPSALDLLQRKECFGDYLARLP